MSVYTLTVSFLSVLLVVAAQIDYGGHSVLRVLPTSEQDVQALKILLEHSQVDVWKEPSVPNSPVDLRVTPEEKTRWLTLLSEHDLQTIILIDDIGSLMVRQVSSRTDVNSLDLDTSRYYTLDEINEYVDEVAAECGAECTVIDIGPTCEGRTMKMIKIGRAGSDRKAVWVDAGIHAREWIAPAVAMYFIERLIKDDGVDPEVTELRDEYDWYVVPVVNPDGYEYTWTNDRMWRKTRCNHGEQCSGVDGNRNFDFMWNEEGGASDNPCSDSYRGPFAASEPEIQAIQDFIEPMRTDFRFLMSMHSYGQILLYPWGYTHDEDPDDLEDLQAVAEIGVNAINSVHDAGYVHGHTTGTMTGNTMDWAYGAMEIKYSYTLELRDQGQFGFMLPPDQILPTGEEAWAGMKAMTLEILSEGSRDTGDTE